MTALRALVGLSARTEPIPPEFDVDLLTVASDFGFLWESDGAGVAGRGVAARIALPRGLSDPDAAETVRRELESIACPEASTAAGGGPIAIGALPFDRTAPTELVIPAVTVRRMADGRAWITSVAACPEPPMRAWLEIERTGAHRSAAPDGFTLRSPIGHDEWGDIVRAALVAIDKGTFAKVVLAREVIVEANAVISRGDVLRRLRALYPSCISYSVDGFLGASPELLVSREGDVVRSHPLAGTGPRSGDPHADEATGNALLRSPKEREEHAHVVDAVSAGLAPVCSSVTVPARPSIVPLRNVLHLGTDVTGRLRADMPRPSALGLAARLHPTPAVAGAPTDRALDWLRDNERLDRGRYAGPVGWVDTNGDGAFAIGIRCAEVHDRTAQLFAGVGVVAGSEPAAELTETQLKLQALLAAIVRP